MENIDIIKTLRCERKGQMMKSHIRTYETSITSRADAVKAFCCECIGWEDVKEAVTDCRGYGCPLYFHRPHQYDNTQFVANAIHKEDDEAWKDSDAYKSGVETATRNFYSRQKTPKSGA